METAASNSDGHSRQLCSPAPEIALWLGVWVIGLGGFGYVAAERHVPAIEQHVQQAVMQRVAELAAHPIQVTVEGHLTTLRGPVRSAAERERLRTAAHAVIGVRDIDDQLVVAPRTDAEPALSAFKPAAFDLDLWPTPTTSNDKILTPERPTHHAPRTLVLGSLMPPWRAPAVFNRENPEPLPSAPPVEHAAPAPEKAIRPVALVDGASPARSFRPPYAVNDLTMAETQDWIIDMGHGFGAAGDPEQTEDVGELSPAKTVAAPDKPHNELASDTTPDTFPMTSDDTTLESPENGPELPKTPTAAPAGEPGESGESGESATILPDESGADPLSEQVSDLRAAFEALPDTRILFQSNSDVPTSKSLSVLDQIATILLKYPDVFVDIGGHTDSAGNEFNNLYLSQQRSNAVRDYLVDRGVSPYRLLARGFGESLPIADNTTSEGRAANRRIEFAFGADGEL